MHTLERWRCRLSHLQWNHALRLPRLRRRGHSCSAHCQDYSQAVRDLDPCKELMSFMTDLYLLSASFVG